jgi:hypothetical protein
MDNDTHLESSTSQDWHLFWIALVLSRVFRGKFVAGLKTAFHAGALQFHGHLLPLAQPRCMVARSHLDLSQFLLSLLGSSIKRYWH